MKKRGVVLIGVGVVALVGLVAVQPLSWGGEHGGKDVKEHGGAAVQQAPVKEHSEAEHAKEHGGQEHGGTAVAPATAEHGGTTIAAAEPTPEAVRSAIREFISTQETTDGAFTVFDANALKIRNLQLAQVHERVGKTGDYYYSCTDMKDTQTGELLDLDFDVKNMGGSLKVIATRTRIHKVNGGSRYTYDENDNMIAATN